VKEYQLRVTGMTCGNCVRHVTAALQGVAGVVSARVRLPGEAWVEAGPDVAPEALVAAVRQAGYDAAATA
jgi:copper chaperone CopZ